MKYLNKWSVFEAYNSYEEFESYVINFLKKYNIMQSEMMDLIEGYHEVIRGAYEVGKQPFQVANQIANEMELDSGGLMQYKMGTGNRYQEIKYL